MYLCICPKTHNTLFLFSSGNLRRVGVMQLRKNKSAASSKGQDMMPPTLVEFFQLRFEASKMLRIN